MSLNNKIQHYITAIDKRLTDDELKDRLNEIVNRKNRKATNEEILHNNRLAVKWPDRYKILYRHFVKEMLHGRSKTGVQHRDTSRGKLIVKNGVPYVKYNGKLEKLTATHTTFNNGNTIVWDLRIDNPYLKGAEDH